MTTTPAIPYAITCEPLPNGQAIRVNAQAAGLLSAHFVVPIAAVPQLVQALQRAVEQLPRVILPDQRPEPPIGMAGAEPPTGKSS